MNIDTSRTLGTIRGLAESFLAQLPHIAIGLVVFLLFFFAATGVRTLIRNVNQRLGRQHNVGLVLGRLAQGAIVLVGLLVALVIAVPGFQPGQLIQVLGLSTVAIGFAFQDIFKNFLAGILILLSQPFRIGDQIIVGKGGFEGTVEEIQTRATFIKTYDGRRVVIPNADLFSDSVIVNTAYDKRRLEYDFGIGYGDDVERARGIIRDALSRTEGVLADPAPEVLLVGLGDFAVNLRARWWIHPPRQADLFAVKDHVISAVKKALTEGGVDLPFPTQQILLHDQSEETDGDRARQREGWPAGKTQPPPPRPIAAGRERLARALPEQPERDPSTRDGRS